MKILFYLFLLLLPSNLIIAQAYKISVKVRGMENSEMKLAYYFADKKFITATAKADDKGKATFEGTEKLLAGLYFVALDNNNYFDILIDNDQQFSLESDTTNLINSMKISGSDDNEIFYSYQQKLNKFQKEKNEIEEKIKKVTANKPDEQKKLQTKKNELDSLMTNLWKTVVEKHNDSFFAKLLRATQSEEILNDERLLRTPFIFKIIHRTLARNILKNHKTNQYIALTANHVEQIDSLIERSRANEKVFQYVLDYLLNFYNTFQLEGVNEVFVHIVEKYYASGQAKWQSEENLKSIASRAEVLGSSFVGKIAPNIKMQQISGEPIDLHHVKARYTLLFFYSIGCGHCEEAAHKIDTFFQTNPKIDVVVFGVKTKGSEGEWKEFIEKNNIGSWLNCHDPNNESNYGSLFYVINTPLLIF